MKSAELPVSLRLGGSPTRKKRLSWQMQKRKWQFQVMSAFRKQLAAPDDVYEQNEQRFLGLLQKLLDIRKSLEHYRTTALPVYCTSTASLGADVWCVVSVDAVGKGTDAEKFRHAMCAVNETKEAKNHFFNADAVLSGAVRFLDIHINAMKSVKSQILHRKQMKLEFDCYEQKVSRLKQRRNSQGDCQRLERNEGKLQNARKALQEVTLDLYRVFAKYESERDTMLNGELEMVRQVMHNFYAKNAEATDFVISESVDRGVADQRTEDIFKLMVAKEMEQSSMKLLMATPAPISLSSSASAPSLPLCDITTHDSVNISAGLAHPPPAPATFQVTAADTDPGSVQSQPTNDEQQQSNVNNNSNSSNNNNNNNNNQQHQPEQPELEASEDELTEKLRTIQLSRPAMPPIKTFRLGRPIYKNNP